MKRIRTKDMIGQDFETKDGTKIRVVGSKEPEKPAGPSEEERMAKAMESLPNALAEAMKASAALTSAQLEASSADTQKVLLAVAEALAKKTAPTEKKQQPRQWDFNIERDDVGRISKISATSVDS